MEPTSPSTDPGRAAPADGGRVAVPEIAELLHLQRPAAAVAAAAVVLVGLGLSIVLPDVVPAGPLTGLVVGILALLAAVAAAVVLDGRDPVLRGPRHLRRDGHPVLARMPGPDPVRHGAPVLAALERRLDGREHVGVVLLGTGADPSELAVALGRGAAADGHTSLVIDLRASSAPGVADVGEGRVRLGEAAQLATDRPYAWIGAGTDRDAAAKAAANVARRPPRDLQLLLVVAPEAATRVPELLTACERTILLVAADNSHRAMVSARIDALRRAGATPEVVVVGGVRADDQEPTPIAPLGITGDGPEPVPGTAAATATAAAAATATGTDPTPPRSTSVNVVPKPPAPPAMTDPASAESGATEGDTSEAGADAAADGAALADDGLDLAAGPDTVAADDPDDTAPEPVSRRERIPDPFAPLPPEVDAFDPAHGDAGADASDDAPADASAAAAGADAAPASRATPATPPAPAAPPTRDPFAGTDPFAEPRDDAADEVEAVRPQEPPAPEPEPEPTPPEPEPPAPGPAEPGPSDPRSGLDDTGPMPPVVFRTTSATTRETDVDGLADADPLQTLAALDHLTAQRRQQRDGRDRD